MSENRIAIIMAAYNAEQTVERALQSVIEQTYQIWTVVVIDDGSTDRTAEIVKEYAEIDGRIKLYSRKNGGAMSAKRMGIEKAQECDYLTFLDSDDYYMKRDLLQLLNQVIEEDGADCVCFNFSLNGKAPFSDCPEKKIFQGAEDILKNILCRTIIDGNMPFALYKYEIVQRFFKVRECEEDDYWNKFDILQHSRKVIYIPVEGYFYYKNMDSLSHRTLQEKNYLYYLHAKKFCNFYAKKFPGAKLECDYFPDWVLLNLGIRLREDKKGKQISMYHKVLRQLRREWINFMKNPYFSNKERIKYVLVCIGGYRIADKLWNRILS